MATTDGFSLLDRAVSNYLKGNSGTVPWLEGLSRRLVDHCLLGWQFQLISKESLGEPRLSYADTTTVGPRN